MEPDEMEIYPIEHKGKVYNIITASDMTFREVRGMLDWLAGQGAFAAVSDDELPGSGRLFSLVVDGVKLEVDVQGYEVIVYRRTP